ncbi:MAG TPA: hypothetical protein VLD37_03125 [Candidatus Bilamarchaeum sp.]|nr:hypothetical protein [Candidatus Bilamarchaeum sp.]
MKLLIIALALAALSFAHLENGVDRQVGPYILDTGWEPAAPGAGEPVFFAINIVDAKSEEKTNFTEVWVRFSRGDRIAYAGTMAMDEGSASFSYEFPEAGTWDMDMKFGNYSDKVEIEVPGSKAGQENALWLAGAVVLGAIAGGAAMFLLK